jgi:drug/metabolite transporter (DMT)-like permease
LHANFFATFFSLHKQLSRLYARHEGKATMPPSEELAPAPALAPARAGDAAAAAAAARRATFSSLLPFLLLVCAVASASTGTTWFALQRGSSPILKAAWRMQLTVVMQLPLMLQEWSHMSPALWRRFLRATALFTLPMGLVLGGHFALVAASVQSTSLAHAILACNCPPLFIIAASVFRYGVSNFVLGDLEGGRTAATTAAEGGGEGAKGGKGAALSETAQWTNSSDTQKLKPPSALLQAELDDWGVQDAPAPAPAPAPVVVVATATPGAGAAAEAPVATAEAAGAETEEVEGNEEEEDLSVPSYITDFFAPELSRPPTAIESVGALVSFAGICLLVGGSTSAGSSSSASAVVERAVTVEGDLYGVAASAFLAAYFSLGARLRKWMPLWSWMCPLHISAAVVTTLLGWAVEGGRGPYGPFAWVTDNAVFGYALGAAFFAGMIGHGIANYVMATLSPLVVSVAMLGQPIIGSVIAYLIGIQPVPGVITIIAGPVIIAGAFLTTVGGREKGLTWGDVFRCRLMKKKG